MPTARHRFYTCLIDVLPMAVVQWFGSGFEKAFRRTSWLQWRPYSEAVTDFIWSLVCFALVSHRPCTVNMCLICFLFAMHVYICIYIYILSLTQEPGRPKDFGLSGSRPRSTEKLSKTLQTLRSPQTLLESKDTARLLARAKSISSRFHEHRSIEAPGICLDYHAFSSNEYPKIINHIHIYVYMLYIYIYIYIYRYRYRYVHTHRVLNSFPHILAPGGRNPWHSTSNSDFRQNV